MCALKKSACNCTEGLKILLPRGKCVLLKTTSGQQLASGDFRKVRGEREREEAERRGGQTVGERSRGMERAAEAARRVEEHVKSTGRAGQKRGRREREEKRREKGERRSV